MKTAMTYAAFTTCHRPSNRTTFWKQSLSTPCKRYSKRKSGIGGILSTRRLQHLFQSDFPRKTVAVATAVLLKIRTKFFPSSDFLPFCAVFISFEPPYSSLQFRTRYNFRHTANFMSYAYILILLIFYAKRLTNKFRLYLSGRHGFSQRGNSSTKHNKYNC